MLANTIKNIIDDYKNEGKSLTQNDLAKVLGMTKQSFSNKMQRDTFTVEDMIKISESKCFWAFSRAVSCESRGMVISWLS